MCKKKEVSVPSMFVFYFISSASISITLYRNPKLVFAHFDFLLESPDLLKNFIHIIHAQVSGTTCLPNSNVCRLLYIVWIVVSASTVAFSAHNFRSSLEMVESSSMLPAVCCV